MFNAIPTFWYNMRYFGIAIFHDGDRLQVNGNPNEFIRNEIVKRAEGLAELLKPIPESPRIIAQYLHHPLTDIEADDLRTVANNRGWTLDIHLFHWDWFAFKPRKSNKALEILGQRYESVYVEWMGMEPIEISPIRPELHCLSEVKELDYA